MYGIPFSHQTSEMNFNRNVHNMKFADITHTWSQWISFHYDLSTKKYSLGQIVIGCAEKNGV